MRKKLTIWQRIFPWLREPPDPKRYLRAKAMMLGAGAGSAIRPGADGKVRVKVEEVEDDDG